MSLALLIGFSYHDGKKPSLPYTCLDIEKIEKYIKHYGFPVIKITDYIDKDYKYIDLSHFIDTLISILQHKNRIFLFYSGHANKDQCLIMPNLELLSTSLLFEILNNHTEKDAKILSIFDSCYGSCFPLPFERRSDIMIYNKDGLFTEKNIICISATPELLEAEMKSDGSAFTKYFLTLDLMKITGWIDVECGRLLSSYPSLEFSL